MRKRSPELQILKLVKCLVKHQCRQIVIKIIYFRGLNYIFSKINGKILNLQNLIYFPGIDNPKYDVYIAHS